MYQETEEPINNFLRFGPFTSIFSTDTKVQENIKKTDLTTELNSYRTLFSRLIIDDNYFKIPNENQKCEKKTEDGLDIQANRKNLDKLKRKIKRGIAERARLRTQERRKERQKKASREALGKKVEKGGSRKGKDGGNRKSGGGKSPSPSRKRGNGKDSKKDRSNKKGKKKGGKGSRSPSPRRRKDKDDKKGKRERKGETRGKYRKRSASPAKERSRGTERRSRSDMNATERRRHRSGSPPPDRGNMEDTRPLVGKYGKKRKAFRYSKRIMRRIKARYMEEKAKKIFQAKIKRGHKIKYWRQTPKNRDAQRRKNLEREYGKRGAYEILQYEHRERQKLEARAKLKPLDKKGKDFHSGEEDYDDDFDRRIEESKKHLHISGKVHKLLKKSAAHILTGKKKPSSKSLQIWKDKPPSFHERSYDINRIIESSNFKTYNKKEMVLYTPDKEERFVVEEMNYEDPWEEPQRNRIAKVREKKVKIRILKDYHKQRLQDRPQKKKKIDDNEVTIDQWADEPDDEEETRTISERRQYQNERRYSGDEDNGSLIQGSFQRRVTAGWRDTRNTENYKKDYFKNNKPSKTPSKYNVSLVKKWNSQRETPSDPSASFEVAEEQECYEDEGDEEVQEGNHDESQYSDLGNETESEDEESQSEQNSDGRSVSEDYGSEEDLQSQYTETDQGNDSETFDDGSQISQEDQQESAVMAYTSYDDEGQSQSDYNGSELDGDSDLSYDSE